jgi:hypothetical protein
VPDNPSTNDPTRSGHMNGNSLPTDPTCSAANNLMGYERRAVRALP